MTPRCVLAIDNGSQSTKVHVVDADGVVHASAQRPLQPYAYPVPGHVVHAGDDLWDSITATCRAAIGAFAGDPSEIEAVGLCTIRFCRAYLDARGRLVEPVLSWMDERVSRAFEDRPEVAHVTTSSGYITVRMTGQLADTAANYAGMWPLDPVTRRWSLDDTAYAATGMPREKLFELVDPGSLLGRVTREAAGETGIPEGTPVFATANDKAVEALGAGVDSETVLLSLGTYIAAMTSGTEPHASSPDYWVNYASVPGGYLYESNGVRRGMWTVSWVRDLLLPPGTDLPPGVAPETVLDGEAVSVEPGCGGLFTLLDWLAPSDAPHRRGAFLGFDGTQGRAHLYRSVLEGIALTMADNIERMEDALGLSYSSVVVTGGGARSDLMMHILADVLDRPTRRTGHVDAAGLGAAICAAVGAGIHPTWHDAKAGMVRQGTEFTAEPGRVDAYVRARAKYREIRHYTDGLFERLAQ